MEAPKRNNLLALYRQQKLQNGISYNQAKDIRNAIIKDDVAGLKNEFKYLIDKNYLFDLYHSNFFIIDWRNSLRMSDGLPHSMSLLHLASYYGSYGCVEYLLGQKLDVNLYSKRDDKQFYTPLHYLVAGEEGFNSNHKKVASLLLSAKADLDRRICNNKEKQTAYEFATIGPKKPQKIQAENKKPSSIRDLFAPYIRDPDIKRQDPRSKEIVEKVASVFVEYENKQNQEKVVSSLKSPSSVSKKFN